MAEAVAAPRQVGERMRRDAVLPADIRPDPGATGPGPRAVLLTGGTGFLGRYLLRELLASGDRTLFCLVRAADHEAARSRLLSALNAAGAGLLAPDVPIEPDAFLSRTRHDAQESLVGGMLTNAL